MKVCPASSVKMYGYAFRFLFVTLLINLSRVFLSKSFTVCSPDPCTKSIKYAKDFSSDALGSAFGAAFGLAPVAPVSFAAVFFAVVFARGICPPSDYLL
tara:strand:- start:6546 stop:6842 length:297 start_codon:yes stop_codon:yes gene_type:complete